MSYLSEPVEIVNWKVEVWGPSPKTEDYRLAGIGPSQDARKGVRQAYFPEAGGYVDCPVYDRYSLTVGEPITGPAIIEERESTCVVGVGDAVTLDDRGNLFARINMEKSQA